MPGRRLKTQGHWSRGVRDLRWVATLCLGCGLGWLGTANEAAAKTTPTVTVTPSATSITTAQSLTVKVAVSGAPAPTGTVTLSSGSYASPATKLASGSANIGIAGGALPVGSDTLKATYTPDSSSSSAYNAATGTSAAITVTQAKTTPKVTVTLTATSITTAQALSVTVAVSGGSGHPAATGTVTLSSGGFTSAATTLTSGSASISILAGSLAIGSDVLTASYTPDAASSFVYNAATGTSAAVTVTQAKTTPTVTVTPAAFRINSAQTLAVTVAVSSASVSPTPTGSVTLASGNYRSAAATLANGSATTSIAAGALAVGNDTLKATYTPDSSSSPFLNAATGSSAPVTVTVPPTTPKITVTPAASSVTTAQALSVAVAVSGGNGHPTPTGTVTLSSGGYSSTAAALSGGSANITIAAGSLTAGSDKLTAAYTPDTADSSIYNPATGTSAAVTVIGPVAVTVDQSSAGPAVTDQILGMNMASWYDPTTQGIVPAFAAAGIKAVRWPGGSWSDDYHWKTNSLCGGTPNSNATFSKFVNDLAIPAGLDVALTANYGTNTACNGPGDPAEAGAWAAAAQAAGIHVSHFTVGNEEYGSWEDDKHTKKNNGATYAAAVAGTNGYYKLIKTASPNTLVGVDVEPGYAPWDQDVMSGAPYDFVEYHYYPETPGQENDTFLVQQAAQGLTAEINTIKSELTKWGTPNTPIYVGEIGGPYSDPGKQSWSITQGLYAGQVLGEMMNDGVSRLTWWIGFGNCNGNNGNDSSSLYGWQNFGAYNVFADGAGDRGGNNSSPCNYAGPIGTMSPTARAFQLFSNVAIDGEHVLTAGVAGDKTDVRAYAATHSGGTALVLFNLNQTLSLPVVVTLSVQSASTGVTVETYSKAIYDQSKTNAWAPPTTTNLGAQSLPLTLTLDPWSMNVVLIR